MQTNRIGSVSYTSGSSELIPDYNYIYDSNGNITTVYSTEFEINYLYDDLNRLVRENNSASGKTTIYTYDKSGDILTKTEYPYTMSSSLGTATATINYQYGDTDCPNGLTSYNGETVTYDANGNPLTYRGYTMNWEKGRQLASMTKNGTSLSFKYDASGLRTEKSQGSVKTEYTYVGEKLVSMKSGSTILNFSYGADGSPYGFTYNGTSYFYLLNLQGDVIGIYDASGNVVVRYTYDSWGKLVSTTANNSAIALSNPLRYRGYVYDSETNLYYLQSRYYDPDTGRFINADSLLIAGNDCIQGANMFSYCYNNPVMYSDPSGYSLKDTVKEIICNTGVAFLEEMEWTLAAKMFEHAFWGGGKNFGLETSLLLISEIKKSSGFSNKLKSTIMNNISNNTLVNQGLPGMVYISDFKYEFKADEPNLHYSIQHADYDIIVFCMFDYCIAIITISDTYDFTEIRTIDEEGLNFSFSNLANDFGYVLQYTELIDPYDWSVTFFEVYQI